MSDIVKWSACGFSKILINVETKIGKATLKKFSIT